MFTPGPIVILGKNKLTEVGGFTVIGKNEIATAYVANEGDAKLYAAAPELLEALKEASDYLNGNHGLNNIGANSLLHKKFKSAISKAEGR